MRALGLNALGRVDSEATYTLLPEEVWQAIGLSPKREHTFTLADGSMIIRKVSKGYPILPQGERHTPVISGEADDEARLGGVALEILGLVLDPFKRRLQPTRMSLIENEPTSGITRQS